MAKRREAGGGGRGRRGLLGRLTLARKFAVVGLVLTVPVALSTSSSVARSFDRMREAERAQTGADCLGVQLLLMRTLGDTRLAVGSGSTAGLDMNRIDRAEAEACRDVGDVVVSSWRPTRLTIHNALVDGSEFRVASWSKAIRAVRDHMVRIGEASRLTFDPQPSTHHLHDLLAGSIAELLEQGSRYELIRAQGQAQASRPLALADPVEIDPVEIDVVRNERRRVSEGLRAISAATDDRDTKTAADQWRQSFERLDLSTSADVLDRLTDGPNLDRDDLDRFGGWLALRLAQLLDDRASTWRTDAMTQIVVTLVALALAVVCAIALFRSVSRPVRSLLATLEGDSAIPGVEVVIAGTDEFARIGAAVRQTVLRLAERDAQAHLDTTQDPVTQLPSRTVAIERIIAAMERQPRDRVLSVSIVDLENLQLINDTYGKHNGDEMLRTVASRLRTTMPDVDLVARISGDQFAVVSERGFSVDDAVDLAHHALTCLSEPMPLLDEPGVVHLDGANVGVVIRGWEQTMTAEQLIEDADVAVLAASQAGRGQVCLFDGTLRQANRRRLDLRVEMRLAASGPQATGFSVDFEPIVEVAHGAVVAYESVLGWINPRFGVVTRDEFLPIAEQVGAIGALGRFVLHEAVTRVRALRGSQPETYVSLNVDERDLAAGELLKAVQRVLDDDLVPADALCLEVSMGALPRDGDPLEALVALRERGVRIALDDVGIGAGAVSGLSRLGPAVLKLDPALGPCLTGDGAAATVAVVGSLVDLGQKLGLEVVVQGIATIAELAVVRELGAFAYQGPLSDRPDDAVAAEHQPQPMDAQPMDAQPMEDVLSDVTGGLSTPS